MVYDFSVIVLSYNPDYKQLVSTLKSVLLQKDCRFEIIVADDGSKEFRRETVEDLFEQYHFSDYQMLIHEQNQGTVKNLLDAAQIAKGKYVKPISPGDYLYEERVLHKLYSFMERHLARVAFGRMVCYCHNDEFQVFDMKTPWNDEIYDAEQRYSYRRAVKNQLIYLDNICGASVAYEADVFRKELACIAGTVRYAEDSMLQLMALEGQRIYMYPDYIVWYEYGTGISTRRTPSKNNLLRDDFFRFYTLLWKEFPNRFFVFRALRNWNSVINAGWIGTQVRRFTQWDKIIFLIRRRFTMRKYRCLDYDESFFRMISE